MLIFSQRVKDTQGFTLNIYTLFFLKTQVDLVGFKLYMSRPWRAHRRGKRPNNLPSLNFDQPVTSFPFWEKKKVHPVCRYLTFYQCWNELPHSYWIPTLVRYLLYNSGYQQRIRREIMWNNSNPGWFFFRCFIGALKYQDGATHKL